MHLHMLRISKTEQSNLDNNDLWNKANSPTYYKLILLAVDSLGRAVIPILIGHGWLHCLLQTSSSLTLRKLWTDHRKRRSMLRTR